MKARLAVKTSDLPPPPGEPERPAGSDGTGSLLTCVRRHPFQVASVLVVFVGGFRVLWVARGNFDTAAVLLETTSLSILGANLVLSFAWILLVAVALYPLTSDRLRGPIRSGRPWPALAYGGLWMALGMLIGLAAGADSPLLDRGTNPLARFLVLGLLVGALISGARAATNAAIIASASWRLSRDLKE